MPTDSVRAASLASRDPTLWPFSQDSIWNLPLGANAVYLPANIKRTTAQGMTTDPDVLILTPNAPVTAVYYNGDGWSGRSRCDAQGGVLFNAPIPADFVVPGAGPGSTPNFATAILMADGHSLVQGQPMARCSANATGTMWWFTQNDLFGTGLYGGHGGSMLSSIGGTIRLGELVPGGIIRHALKVNLDGSADLYYDSTTRGYRWPAKQADSCASSCYGGGTKALRMGSLVALPPSTDIAAMGLETEPAKILAKAFQDYGAYVVDDTAWSVYAVATEFSPRGRVESEFLAAWGMPIDPASKDVPWARDMDRIFGSLDVVDNWDSSVWQATSASNGTQGVGGGAPRVAWAPDFGPDSVPPVASVSLSGTPGASNWYLSAVDVTVTATDTGSGVASIHVRTDGGTWQTYTAPMTIQGDGSHTVDYYATDVAGNVEPSHSAAFQIDTVAPVTTHQASGNLAGDGSFLSPATVTLTGSDATSGVQSIQYRLDGGAWRAYGSPFPIRGNGTHTLDYFGTDSAGNPETPNARFIRISGDTRGPPVTTLASNGRMGANGWYVSSVAVTLSVTSGMGSATTITYRIDGGSWSTYAGPFSLTDGRHILEFQAFDSAGYTEAARSATFDIDSTAPTIVWAQSGATVAPGDTLSWIGSDATSGIARYEVSLDGGASQVVGLETSVTRLWTDGPHSIVVRAFDGAGNEGTSVLQFNVGGTAATPPGPPLVSASLVGGVIAILVAGAAWGMTRTDRRPRRPSHAARATSDDSVAHSRDDSETPARVSAGEHRRSSTLRRESTRSPRNQTPFSRRN